MDIVSKTAFAGFAGIALCGASAVIAVDLPDPVYTYCELEQTGIRTFDNQNDAFDYLEIVDAPSEFSECFYITGKLQKDYVWDRQPKCCLVIYSKPLTAFDASGRNLGLVEEVLAVSNPFDEGEYAQLVTPVLDDGTVRVGVTSVFDCFDGTLNGLFSNDIHGDTGKVLLDLDFFIDEPIIPDLREGYDEEYEFEFKEGREALRASYIAPAGMNFAIVRCHDSFGDREICWDIDFYWVRGLTPRELYCITQVGGKDYDCEATDTVLGWFDKNGNLQGGALGIAKTSEGNNVPEYPELCVIADDMGDIRFAISGCSDINFNGLDDIVEGPFLEFLEEEGYIENLVDAVIGEGWIPGTDVRDPAGPCIRLTREDFDEFPNFAFPPAHGVCGCYTLKVRLNEHTDEGDDDDDFTGGGLAARADMSGDGLVDAVDLAMLLSFWGPVQ